MSAAHSVLEPGTVLQGTYQVVRLVGEGGMGEVYEARHARLPGRFAVKVLRARVAGGSPEYLRFQREAEILSSLRHPHIVQLVDFNQAADGAPYIVMEFLDGADLGAVLQQQGPLAPGRVAALVEQVASALAAAHGQGIIHRDLKPQNVFLVPVPGQPHGYAKVLDFGTSKVKSALSLTGESHLMGTPQYMAPEQAEGDGQDVDGRSDQFALAAVAYEMLSGRRAFVADSIPAVLYKVAHEDPPPLASLVPALGPAVDAVLARALAKEKRRRYGSVLELAAALAAALPATVPESPLPAGAPGWQTMPLPAAPARVAPPLADVARPADGAARLAPASVARGRRWVVPALAAGAMLAAAALVTRWRGKPAAPSPRPAPPARAQQGPAAPEPVIPAAPVAVAAPQPPALPTPRRRRARTTAPRLQKPAPAPPRDQVPPPRQERFIVDF